MKTGLSTYTYTWSFGIQDIQPVVQMTPYDLIDKAHELKVDCVQIADNCDLTMLDQKAITGISGYASEKNIGIETGFRGLTDEHLDQCIQIAYRMSSPLVRMVIDTKEYKPEPDSVVAIIRNALSGLEAKKITLALENHDRLPSAVFKSIIEKVNSEYAGICLDCVNSMGIGEGLETVIENLAPYTVNLHVKDFSVKRMSHMMGFIVEGKPAGQGLLDLQYILGKLKPYNKCNSAILELWTPPASTMEETFRREHEWASESILFMKKIISDE